ncbi:leucine--tRNA ligase [soil metagenome]
MAEHVYDPTAVEKKWQRTWDENKTNEIDLKAAKNPYYVLMMFPYPSAEGLHVGNVYAFTGADIYARHRRLRGYDVFEPIGYDAFGIHSENFAMKVNRHPSELIPSNVRNFEKQLRMMGFMFDWRRTVDTTLPEYYKWTQWVFLQLYKAGYAYRDVKEVNFCPACGTVIADEQVNADGTCERHHDTMVERRKLPCWFFRTTAFADQLSKNHEWIDWSERTRIDQLEWLGRSEGAEVDFKVAGHDEKIRVFTTRPDTLFGATFMVLAVDHPLVATITTAGQRSAIDAYKEGLTKDPDAPADAPLGKTGAFTGAYAINPTTELEIPIYVSDYVLMGYGTGAIMAVPAHDERDFEFARTFKLPIQAVIDPDEKALADYKPEGLITAPDPTSMRDDILRGELCWSGAGVAINSANEEVSINGLGVTEAKSRITSWLVARKLGHAKTTFRLRDWGISRQRYWGPPIPIIYDEEGNAHAVPEDQLPVELPPLTDFRPKGDGRGPLATATDWVNVTLPDGRPGRRETDVMDNFLDSAWYYLRYVSTDRKDVPYDPAMIAKWLPVDMYIGGNEHAKLHLMYTRFICMALTAAGALKMGKRDDMKDSSEPFRHFKAHGLIIKDGAKMSKSKGNIVNPDAYVEQWGADTLRLYLMFLGPYQQGGDFRDKDIQGMRRFLNRLHQWYFDAAQPVVPDEELPKPLRVKTHQTIKKVRNDIDSLNYNTAISACMELLNEARAAEATSNFIKESLILCLAPLAPHFAEEVWQGALGKKEGIWTSGRFPEFIEALTKLDEVEIALQHNGKIRGKAVVPRETAQADLERIALADEGMIKSMAGAAPKKIIVVPGRLVNVIA